MSELVKAKHRWVLRLSEAEQRTWKKEPAIIPAPMPANAAPP